MHKKPMGHAEVWTINRDERDMDDVVLYCMDDDEEWDDRPLAVAGRLGPGPEKEQPVLLNQTTVLSS